MRIESENDYLVWRPETVEELVLALTTPAEPNGFLLGDGLYRGQADANWGLVSSLGRVAHEDEDLVWWWEEALLDQFMRKAAVHLPRVPHELAVVEWLVLMQHYGAPTRLLDWTRSPLVALFFALEGCYPTRSDALGGSCAIWAMWPPEFGPSSPPSPYDGQRIHLESADTDSVEPVALGRWHETAFRKAIEANSPVPLIIDPLHPDERMLAQRGVLTALCSLTASFDVGSGKLVDEHFQLRKLEIPIEWAYQLHWILRNSGISYAALFPGIDGVGRTVRHEVELTIRSAEFD